LQCCSISIKAPSTKIRKQEQQTNIKKESRFVFKNYFQIKRKHFVMLHAGPPSSKSRAFRK
jgi:hypothetical protein